MAGRGTVGAVYLLASLVAGTFLQPENGLASDRLFGDALESRHSEQTEVAKSAEVLRARSVTVDIDLLNKSSEVGDAFILNLFDDTSLKFRLKRTGTAFSGAQAWMGDVEGFAWSFVVLVERQGRLAGSVRIPGAAFRIRALPDGLHMVAEIDDTVVAMVDDAVALPPLARRDPLLTPRDSGALVDVLVVYTSEALNAVGDVASMEADIAHWEAYTNAAYQNSGVNYRIRVVDSVEVTYDEAARGAGSEGFSSTALGDLQGKSDGYMDEVHAIRDSVCADAVALIVAGQDPEACGIAYIASGASGVSGDFAFSIYLCGGADTFAHELGHNMGAHHDWFVDDNVYNFPYSKGYVQCAEGWRTIMAYADHCGGTRVPHFSNPDVLLGGVPTGVPEGTSLSCVEGNVNNPPCDADNRKVFNAIASAFANIRQSCVPVCGDDAVNLPEEECDGADDAACPGECQIDCRCPFCGDSVVNQASEECDTGGASAFCDADCTLVVCGDGAINNAVEDCEPSDDSACPGECDNCICPGLDHFLCYKTKAKQPLNITLTDQFDSGDYEGKVAKFFCTPADKNGEGVFDQGTHLEAYKIKGGHVPRTSVLMLNQFGSYFFDTKKVDTLMVPTAKSLPPNPPPGQPDPASIVDHYRCVKGNTSKGTLKFAKGIVAQVRDQFGDRELEVKKPSRLCVPTDKNGEGIKNEENHLVCYKVKANPQASATGVQVNNQLGTGTIDLKSEAELCVPSLKNLNCGNNLVDDPAEECDGSDTGLCSDLPCDPDCTCGPADLCTDAIQITSLPFTDSADTTLATVSDDDPEYSCGFSFTLTRQPSVWYSFTAPGDGTISANTVGSGYDTRLVAFTGACGGLTEIACDSGFTSSSQAQIDFPVTSGSTYYLMATTAFGGRGGQLVFNLSF